MVEHGPFACAVGAGRSGARRGPRHLRSAPTMPLLGSAQTSRLTLRRRAPKRLLPRPTLQLQRRHLHLWARAVRVESSSARHRVPPLLRHLNHQRRSQQNRRHPAQQSRRSRSLIKPQRQPGGVAAQLRRAQATSAWLIRYGPHSSTARPQTIALIPRAGSGRAVFSISDPGSTIGRATVKSRGQLGV